MIHRRRAAAGVLVLLACTGPGGAVFALADVTGSNLAEFQSGNYPFTDPTNRWDLYDQLNLDYFADEVRVGLRFELNENSEDRFTYREFTQRYAEWSDGRLRGRVGNFYTILGRGLLHRSFEVPGVVLDDLGIRSRFGPSRDVDGVLAEASLGRFGARALAGRPNGGEFSPAAEEFGLERYAGQLAGGQGALEIYRGARVGAAYLRHSNGQGGQRELGSGFASADLMRVIGADAFALPLYVEYAQAGGTFADWWKFRTGDRDTFALYLASNLLWGPLALSAEYKDYRGFRLGFNDPPSLVREHALTLLNRNTHVLDAGDEEGYQIEGSWTVPAWGTVTANTSRADGENAFGAVRFEEHYVELHAAPDYGRRWEATVFLDQGNDGFDFISWRRIHGGTATARFLDVWAIMGDVQKQDATRAFVFGPPASFSDLYVSGGASRAQWGSLSIVWERTTDPIEEKPGDASSPGIQARNFVAVIVNAVISEQHQATLFVGQRRGGRACTAGTCYEVQPFEGAELRLTTRF